MNTQEQTKVNSQGIRLCNRCHLHPANVPGLPCHQCRVELLKIGQELTKPK